MKIFRLLAILLASLTISNVFASNEIVHIFKLYDNKITTLNFTQTSVNAMSGQKIIKKGKLTIEAKKGMIFDYKNEKVIINNFEAVDYSHSKKYVYKLSGFNKVLFLLFLGKEDVDKLFTIEQNDGRYTFIPKYESNIDKIYAYFNKKGQIDSLTIIDIYSNRTIYQFYAPSSKRTQSGN